MARVTELLAAAVVTALPALMTPAVADDAGPQPAVVISATPLPAGGLDPDLVPGTVQSLSAAELDPDHQSSIAPVAAARRLPGVSLNNEQGSQYQPDFVYRGFEASPISGVPEGIAVYQNGARLNEAFGDSVNWDLIPQFAINRLTVASSNPAFGLNALGGAVTLEMKNGFNSPGTSVQLSAGSFHNLTGYGEFAARSGDFALYGALGGVTDDGFRELSPTHLRQGYLDFGYEHAGLAVHLSGSFADNYLGAVGPTPVQLLASNPAAIFTYPQSTQNEAQLLQLTASDRFSDTLQANLNLYHRHFLQHLVDGNTTGVATCDNNAAFFCLQGDNVYPGDVLYSQAGTPVPTSVLPQGATPGEIDRTNTDTDTNGVGLQFTLTDALFGRPNYLVAGASLDGSTTHYDATGELGTLMPSLEVVGSGTIIDQAQSPTASPPIESPVTVRSRTRYFGVYVSDTWSLTPRLAWTVSGRFNQARIDIDYLSGGALDTSSTYNQFNPGTGITYRLSDRITGYVGYAQANRAPTAGELSCADPSAPCILDAFLVSDPPLRQVIARTLEFGLRGTLPLERPAGSVRWSVSAFRTDNHNDIMLLPTEINGFGYFSNIGTTRRQGLEAGVSLTLSRWQIDLNYALVQATFRETLTLSSNSPAADENGDIEVHPDDRLPLIPEHRITASVSYAPTPRWLIGADARYSSSQYLAGDDSNQEAPLPGFTVVDAHASFRLGHALQLFVGVDNLFDKTYYTYGAFTGLDGLPPNFNLTDPRTYSPNPPRTYFGGFRLTL
ncbi:MAG TPA: TonB-dependent receptor [Steroidobacteraceae bacterium]|nr:TonB-dependent receptor [Steroidobacteraceae bacterium]